MKKTLLALFYIAFLNNGLAQKNKPLDSLKNELILSRNATQKAEIALEIIKNYNFIQPDSNVKYLAIAKKYATESKNKSLIGKIWLAEAVVFQNTGRFTESGKANELAISLFESVNDINGLASAYSALGLLFKKNSGDEFEVAEFSKKALAYEQKALGYYLQGSDTEGLLKVYSNMGIICRDLKDFKSAENVFNKGFEAAKKNNYTGTYLGILKAGYSQVFLDYYKDNKRAIALLDDAIEIFLRNGVRTNLEHAYRNKSYNYTQMGQYDKAIAYGKMAVEIADEVKDPHRQIMAYSSLHHAQKMAGMYRESMVNLEHLNDIEHVLLSRDKAAIIADMNTKYETEKKENENVLLIKTNQLNQYKIFLLVVGFLVLGILFYSVRQKRINDKLLFEKERLIEAQKLENAKIELDAKKKELTAKVLQLARKNEFLNNLEIEIDHLKNNVDKSVNKTTNRISRMIKSDIDSDVQWEQFSQEFSSVHQGFLSALTEKFGNFSKSEIRLISLLKMNMTSKEIADILGISDEGIKKARYRLRQKLNLEDTDLQSFILSFG